MREKGFDPDLKLEIKTYDEWLRQVKVGNMQTAFYVSHAGQTYGPWTVTEITRRIAQMELIATDFIFDEATQGWIPLMECDAILGALRTIKPSAPPPPSAKVSMETAETATTSAPISVDRPKVVPLDAGLSVSGSQKVQDASSEDAEWFVQKDTHRYGPFTYLGLIKALQDKSVYEFDFICRKGEDHWVRLAEHEMFTPDAIRIAMKQSGREGAKFFFARKYPRFPVMSEVIVHDNTSVWLGQTYQASEGGVGVTIRNAKLNPGQMLHLHFAESGGLPAFNAMCEVVNKRYVANVRDPHAAVPYGVKFVNLDADTQRALKEYFSQKAS
ncbi:MAG: PilZ domain-containing protein [Bdellovibrionaceae bacterium]|nr:PilZ domain-containing protein [Pseudobdellovibrionaceae bacterium]